MAAGLVAMLLVGLLYAWSLFRPYLSEMFPSWSATDLSMVFTVSMITFSLSMFVCGKLQIKCGCKVTLLITAVLMGVGFFGASSLDPADPSGSLARLVVFYGVLCGASVGFGYNTALTIVPFWFPKNFGLIVGTLMMAFGISSLVLGGATEGFISAFGLNAAFRMLAILACALLVLATLLCFNFLGAVLSVFLFLLVSMIILGVKNKLALILVPVVMVTFVYLVFKVWLAVPLPAGLLTFLK